MQERYMAQNRDVGFHGVHGTGAKISYKPDQYRQLIVTVDDMMMPVEYITAPKDDGTPVFYISGDNGKTRRQALNEVEPGDELFWHSGSTGNDLEINSTIIIAYELDVKSIPFQKMLDLMPGEVRNLIRLWKKLEKEDPQHFMLRPVHLRTEQSTHATAMQDAASGAVPSILRQRGNQETHAIFFGQERAEQMLTIIRGVGVMMGYLNQLVGLRDHEEEIFGELLEELRYVMETPEFQNRLPPRSRVRIDQLRKTVIRLIAEKEIMGVWERETKQPPAEVVPDAPQELGVG